MSAPYSSDLRQRVLAAARAGRGGRFTLAKLFNLSSSTVYRWIRRFRETGSSEAKRRLTGPVRKIPPSSYPQLRTLVEEKNDATLEEYARFWRDQTGVNVDKATMMRALHDAGLSLKKRRSGRQNVTDRTSSPSGLPTVKRSKPSIALD